MNLIQCVLIAAVPMVSLCAQATEWRGEGMVLKPDGQELSAYHSVTTLTELGSGVSKSETVVSLADGSQKKILQTITTHGSSFSVESTLGHGSGACYGAGLCETYIVADAGKAFAITIVQDSERSRRHLIVELQDGKATRMLRETLTRVN